MDRAVLGMNGDGNGMAVTVGGSIAAVDCVDMTGGVAAVGSAGMTGGDDGTIATDGDNVGAGVTGVTDGEDCATPSRRRPMSACCWRIKSCREMTSLRSDITCSRVESC